MFVWIFKVVNEKCPICLFIVAHTFYHGVFDAFVKAQILGDLPPVYQGYRHQNRSSSGNEDMTFSNVKHYLLIEICHSEGNGIPSKSDHLPMTGHWNHFQHHSCFPVPHIFSPQFWKIISQKVPMASMPTLQKQTRETSSRFKISPQTYLCRLYKFLVHLFVFRPWYLPLFRSHDHFPGRGCRRYYQSDLYLWP